MKYLILGLQIVACLLLTSVTIICWVHHVKNYKGSRHSMIHVLIFVNLLFGFSVMISCLYQSNHKVEQLKRQVCSIYDTIRYGRQDNSSDLLMFRASQTGEYYLRGEIGVIYDEKLKCWKEEPDHVKDSYIGMMEYLEEHGFYPQNQCTLLKDTEDYSNTITIQNLHASRKYIYAPLNIVPKWDTLYSDKQTDPNRIKPISFLGDRSYSFPYVSEEAADWSEHPKIESADYEQCEQIFRSYVYTYYLDIPREENDRLKNASLETVGGKSQAEVLESVRNYLLTKKKLSPAQYAKEAVMLLRFSGIPARYVEGYFVHYEQAGSSQILRQKDQYQWAEVYLDEIGFVTFDVKPQNLYHQITKPENEAFASTTKPVERKQEVERSNKKMVFYASLLMILVLVVLMIRFFLYPKMKKKKYLYSKNMMEFTSFLCIHLEKVLKYDNVLIDMRRPYEYKNVIIQHYGIDFYQLYLRYLYYIDEVQFGQNDLSLEEQAEMRIILKRFEMRVSQNMRPFRRFILLG